MDQEGQFIPSRVCFIIQHRAPSQKLCTLIILCIYASTFWQPKLLFRSVEYQIFFWMQLHITCVPQQIPSTFLFHRLLNLLRTLICFYQMAVLINKICFVLSSLNPIIFCLMRNLIIDLIIRLAIFHLDQQIPKSFTLIL